MILFSKTKLLASITSYGILLIIAGCITTDEKSCENTGKSKTMKTDSLRNFYVAQEDANADDKNTGTEARPFKSVNGCLNKIKNELKAGDTIWVKNGVYRESVHLELGRKKHANGGLGILSGENFSLMITLSAYPGEKPEIKGSDVVKNWKKHKGDIWVRENWAINSQQLFVDGELLTQIGTKLAPGYVSSALNWEYKDKILKDMMPGSFHYDDQKKKLYSWLKDGANPNDHLMEASVRSTLLRLGKDLDYIKISGFKMRHGNNWAADSAILLFGKHCIIEDIDQAWHAFRGAKVIGEYNTFLNCKFNYNGNSGMGGAYRGHRILNCETSYNNYRNWSTAWHAGGVKFISDCHDWVVKGHVSSYNNSSGIWFDDGMSNVTIEGCLSFRNRGYGIHYEIGSRGVIKNNICYENAGRGIYISNSSYTLVANNLCYRNGMSGIVSIGIPTRRGAEVYLRGDSKSIPAGHNLIIGNIMVDNCDAPQLIKLCDSWDAPEFFKKRYKAYAERFTSWIGRPELIMPTDIAANKGCFSDYNIFYRSGKRSKGKRLLFARNWDIDYAKGLEDWSKKTGFDKHSKFIKPEFVNEANYDFHPTDTCPSLWFIQKTDMGVKFDFDGNPRPGGRSPRTAGPYGGSKEVFDKLKKKLGNDAFSIIQLPPTKDRDDLWRHVRGIEVAITDQLVLKNITKLAKGVYINSIPYFISRGNEIIISKDNNKQQLPCEKTVKNLNFLITGLDYSKKPFLRCVIHREDGVKVNFQWKGDGKGGITTNADKNLTSGLAWKGFNRLSKIKNDDNAVFVTSWKNNNEWLPIKNIDFELLDPNAKVAILAISGENLKK